MAFGGFALAASAWLFVAAQQGGAVTLAARQRTGTGVTPDWMVAVWYMGNVLEHLWVVFGNLAAVGYGVAVVRTELLPGWLGWTVVGVGLAIPTLVLVTREIFPHQALLLPLALGVGLLVTS